MDTETCEVEMTFVNTETGEVTLVQPPAPEQVSLFPPPPFDFETAYEELHRLDQRARLRKSAWEIAKSDANEAKKSYDAAIDDLHNKFAEVDRARRDALKAAAVAASNEGGDAQMGEPEIEQPTPDGEPTPEPEKRDHDAGIGY